VALIVAAYFFYRTKEIATRVDVLSRQLAAMEAERSQRQSEVQKYQKELDELKARPDPLSDVDKARRELQIHELQDKLNAANADANKLKLQEQQTAKLIAGNADLATANRTLQDRLTQLQDQLDTANREIGRLRNQLTPALTTSDSIVIDGELTWTRSDNGKDINWDGANTYCKELTLAGLSRWRLPTIVELEKLYDPKSGNRYNIRKPFLVQGSGQLFSLRVWSSTKEGSFFSFRVGQPFESSGGSYNSHALCVRRYGE